MEHAGAILPLAVSLIGVLLSVMLGMALSKLNSIDLCMRQLNDKVFAHITQQGIHESAVSRLDEQIKTLFQTVKMAHDRIDRVELKT